MYEAINRKNRAESYRAAALECDRAGFHDFASVNWAMADILDPQRRERPTPRNGEDRLNGPVGTKRPTPSRVGPDPSKVGGRRDAAPMGRIPVSTSRGARA
jgi:hypothetical protein